jgi:hypothetical protein
MSYLNGKIEIEINNTKNKKKQTQLHKNQVCVYFIFYI